jgi:hypothetical protein
MLHHNVLPSAMLLRCRRLSRAISINGVAFPAQAAYKCFEQAEKFLELMKLGEANLQTFTL